MKIKIRMLSSMAGAEFSYQPGDLLDIEERIAHAWAAGGIAEYCSVEDTLRAPNAGAEKNKHLIRVKNLVSWAGLMDGVEFSYGPGQIIALPESIAHGRAAAGLISYLSSEDAMRAPPAPLQPRDTNRGAA